MADTKISGLSAGAPAQATDLIPIARSGANFSITPANILAYGSSPVAGTSGTFTTLSATTGAAVGGATPGAGGVAFPATAVAVADANTLDDYEEGTWTPSVGGTATYNGQTGLYTKIGRMVYIQCYFDILVIGTGSTTTISGLPFAAVNVQGLGMCSQFLNLNTNLIAPGFFPSGSTLRNAGLATAAANSSTDNAIFKSTTRVDFSCSYMAS